MINKGCNKQSSSETVSKVALDVFYNHFKNLNVAPDDADIILPDNISEHNIELS